MRHAFIEDEEDRGPDKPSRVKSPVDGFTRRLDVEEALNIMALRVFGTGGGRDFLDYLQTITLLHISGPYASNEEIRHREGARWLVAVIQKRMAAGRKQGAIHVSEQPTDSDPPA